VREPAHAVLASGLVALVFAGNGDVAFTGDGQEPFDNRALSVLGQGASLMAARVVERLCCPIKAEGLRQPGLAVPGKWVGTFIKDGDTSFWNVANQDKTIVVQLQDDELERSYLTVENSPRGTVDLINAALEQPNQS